MRTILLALNEINFKFIEYYIKQGQLANFKQLFYRHGFKETTSEHEYKLLEPWIQWVTVHTGKTFAEHQVFRLGDIVERPDLLQLFEVLESKGYRVGAVSPFNADNRLKNPAFFVADPWTKTASSGHFLLKQLAKAISQMVNDNAQSRWTPASLFTLLSALAYYTPRSDYGWYWQRMREVKTHVATKPLILDKLLSDVFLKEWKRTEPDFALLFLNSGAHLQHHYLFNAAAYQGELRNPEWYCPAKQDPLLAIYQLYDDILGRIKKLSGVRLVLATGLSQQPHDALTFYWRLKEHKRFLNLIGIDNYAAVHPRMSRDFLIEFANEADATTAQQKIASCEANGEAVFTIDNRGNSLFIELTYPHDIANDLQLQAGAITVPQFREHVAFVALKNGEHNPIGYYLDTAQTVTEPQIPLKRLYDVIINGV